MKNNNEIILNIVGLVLSVSSYLLLNIDNPNNNFINVVLFGLFFSFVGKLIYQIQRLKKLKKENSNQYIMNVKYLKIFHTLLLLISSVFFILFFTYDESKTFSGLGSLFCGIMVLVEEIIRKKENQLKERS